ncbi:hypothetical protein EZI54_06915 [Marinobacter halodurans]|uniref:Integrase n=1 Tax=Marinobacter halodurans TaxID=2528979 RepID=A0ABY1ZQ46_9GAMM|nr:hypothetical protein [Marinobacter halodurans]TBW57382.1 hypothetical protein EZI54_06915 [Marinobacter halodurans]
MGWHNVKIHYRISQYVYMNDGDICIGVLGMSKVEAVIRINTHGESRIVDDSWCNRELAILHRQFVDNQAELRELAQRDDRFKRSIKVYTYRGSEVSETLCENPGWPNVTHDGQIMYVRRFSTDRDTVVNWAIEAAKERIQACNEQLDEIKGSKHYSAYPADLFRKICKPYEDGRAKGEQTLKELGAAG